MALGDTILQGFQTGWKIGQDIGSSTSEALSEAIKSYYTMALTEQAKSSSEYYKGSALAQNLLAEKYKQDIEKEKYLLEEEQRPIDITNKLSMMPLKTRENMINLLGAEAKEVNGETRYFTNSKRLSSVKNNFLTDPEQFNSILSDAISEYKNELVRLNQLKETAMKNNNQQEADKINIKLTEYTNNLKYVASLYETFNKDIYRTILSTVEKEKLPDNYLVFFDYAKRMYPDDPKKQYRTAMTLISKYVDKLVHIEQPKEKSGYVSFEKDGKQYRLNIDDLDLTKIQKLVSALSLIKSDLPKDAVLKNFLDTLDKHLKSGGQ